MTSEVELLLTKRSTDSDMRCALLLAAVRAFQERVALGTAKEEDLLAELAEPMVPGGLRDASR